MRWPHALIFSLVLVGADGTQIGAAEEPPVFGTDWSLDGSEKPDETVASDKIIEETPAPGDAETAQIVKFLTVAVGCNSAWETARDKDYTHVVHRARFSISYAGSEHEFILSHRNYIRTHNESLNKVSEGFSETKKIQAFFADLKSASSNESAVTIYCQEKDKCVTLQYYNYQMKPLGSFGYDRWSFAACDTESAQKITRAINRMVELNAHRKRCEVFHTNNGVLLREFPDLTSTGKSIFYNGKKVRLSSTSQHAEGIEWALVTVDEDDEDKEQGYIPRDNLNCALPSRD